MIGLEASVLVVDDHGLTAEMTSFYLQREGHLDSDHANSLDEALLKVRAKIFDIVLLDLEMPGMNGMRGLERMISANAPGSVVLFSGNVRTEGALKAIELGAKGFIPKTLALKSLLNAVRFVAMGEIFLPQSVISGERKSGRTRSDSSELTNAEREVLLRLTKGMTNKDIARELGQSESGVKMTVRAICQKMDVTNRTQIATTAMMQGLV